MERKDKEREKKVYEASVTDSVSLLKQLMAEDALTLIELRSRALTRLLSTLPPCMVTSTSQNIFLLRNHT